MNDSNGYCGCIVLVAGVIFVVGFLASLFDDSSPDTNPMPGHTANPHLQTPPQIPASTSIALPEERQSNPTTSATTQSSSISHKNSDYPDPYREGYSAGYNQGEEDGRYGLGRAYGYDDSNNYDSTNATKYTDGYETGYNDGYLIGQSLNHSQLSPTHSPFPKKAKILLPPTILKIPLHYPDYEIPTSLNPLYFSTYSLFHSRNPRSGKK